MLGPKAGARAQKVIVKFRFVRSSSRGFRSMVASTAYELRYMEKGDRGHEHYELYQGREAGTELATKDFAERTRHDPHQWRIVLSPERGQDVDLTSVTRRAMAQMEKDTGYQLDWVAANHSDTGHPHTHIVVRGVDREGREVGLKRDYMARSFTYRTQDILTQDLGQQPREQTLEHTLDHAQTLEHDYEGGRTR